VADEKPEGEIFIIPVKLGNATALDEYVYTPDDKPIEPLESKPYDVSNPRPPAEIREVPVEYGRPAKIKVKLADGKERTIQHMMSISFWHSDGTPMSAQQFLELLFGKLPEFFHDEAELRALWSVPDTRRKLLDGLAEREFGKDKLEAMQKLIDAEKSDLFDVLAYVAFALPRLTREERAHRAQVAIRERFNSRQQAFLDFVLGHYVSDGVEELDQEKLTPLLRLKYHDSIQDALADLGEPEEIRMAFTGFQRHLYEGQAGV
jgi:type I restriction enzyme R subunit